MRLGLIKQRDKWSLGGEARDGEGDLAVAIISKSKIHKQRQFEGAKG
jgi:hypothetical protein